MAKTYRKRNPAIIAWAKSVKDKDNSSTMWGNNSFWRLGKLLSDLSFEKWFAGDGNGIKLVEGKRFAKKLYWKRFRKADKSAILNQDEIFQKPKPSVLWDIY